MDRAFNDASSDYRATKIAIGSLAMLAAAAAAMGMTMAAWLFGSLVALALAAGAGFAASFELLDSDRYRAWRFAAWSALVPGWIVLASMLPNGPLPDRDGLRLLGSLLLAGGAALRVWRWQVARGTTPPFLAVALLFALIALVAIWSDLWMTGGAMST